jgi:hypothetical protein
MFFEVEPRWPHRPPGPQGPPHNPRGQSSQRDQGGFQSLELGLELRGPDP